jgi:hypothetical protein
MLVAQVANYYGLGEKRSTREDGSGPLDTIECNLDGICIKIIQNADILNNKSSCYGSVYTTRIETSDSVELEAFKEIVENICTLLKLVSSSQVVPFGYSTDGESFSSRTVKCPSTPSSRPILDTNDGAVIRHFIESTWVKFKECKECRKLNVAIDLLTIAEETGQVQEVKLAIMFMLLETLKRTYADKTGIPFVKKWFRKVNEPGADKEKDDRYHFKELVAEMLCSVNMEYDLSKLYELRNDIIHSAISERTFIEQREIYEDCQDLAREYLLRLLEYHGQPFTYKSRCTEVLNL